MAYQLSAKCHENIEPFEIRVRCCENEFYTLVFGAMFTAVQGEFCFSMAVLTSLKP
jgi:hypothetical protein